jgi:hypothetical protein
MSNCSLQWRMVVAFASASSNGDYISLLRYEIGYGSLATRSQVCKTEIAVRRRAIGLSKRNKAKDNLTV